MGKQEKKTPGAGEIQVFELTMDNPEDQDVLNRQLRKAEEHDCHTVAKTGGLAQGESTTTELPKSGR